MFALCSIITEDALLRQINRTISTPGCRPQIAHELSKYFCLTWFTAKNAHHTKIQHQMRWLSASSNLVISTKFRKKQKQLCRNKVQRKRDIVYFYAKHATSASA